MFTESSSCCSPNTKTGTFYCITTDKGISRSELKLILYRVRASPYITGSKDRNDFLRNIENGDGT